MTDKLVFRGGYGVFNMALHLDNINTLGTNPPTASVQVTNPTVNPVATFANPRSTHRSLETPMARERTTAKCRFL